jgi:hypothetical protein
MGRLRVYYSSHTPLTLHPTSTSFLLAAPADASGDHTFVHPIKYKSTVAPATFSGLAGIVADGCVCFSVVLCFPLSFVLFRSRSSCVFRLVVPSDVAGLCTCSDGGHFTVDRASCKLSPDGSATVRSLKWALKMLETAGDSVAELEAVLLGNTIGPLDSMFGENHFTRMAANTAEAAVLQPCRTLDSRLLLSTEQWSNGKSKVGLYPSPFTLHPRSCTIASPPPTCMRLKSTTSSYHDRFVPLFCL